MKKIVLLIVLSACATGSRGPAGSSAPLVETPPVPATFKVTNTRELNPFAKVIEPIATPARALGGYSNGCLFGAVPMPKSGTGFEMVRLSRNRYYAHPRLVEVLLRGGEALHEEGTMLYGDLAQPRGGPMPGGHASHQSGLDADIWLHKFSRKKKMTDWQREHLYGQSVLRKDYLEIDERKWDEIYTKQLMWFAGQMETERIFVNAAIKRRLCKEFPGDPRLARLRPWFFHDDHFHLRLKCPENEPGCMPQKPAEGIECEEKDLAYWFSKEVIAKFTTPGPSKPFESELPLECKDLVP